MGWVGGPMVDRPSVTSNSQQENIVGGGFTFAYA
jgi:hypothetical protein